MPGNVILEIRVAPEVDRDCAPYAHHPLGRLLYALTYSGVERITNRLQLTWYQTGMTAEVRRTIKSCDVCRLHVTWCGWITSREESEASVSKLQPKFVDPSHVVKAFPNPTYLIVRSEQTSVQN